MTPASSDEDALFYASQSHLRSLAFRMVLKIVGDPNLLADVTTHEWLLEGVRLGAMLREYHAWEKATKVYLDLQARRNNCLPIVWNGKLPGQRRSSHLDQVIHHLASFGAAVPAAVTDAIDDGRHIVNDAKHRSDRVISEAESRELGIAVKNFWMTLAQQELPVS